MDDGKIIEEGLGPPFGQGADAFAGIGHFKQGCRGYLRTQERDANGPGHYRDTASGQACQRVHGGMIPAGHHGQGRFAIGLRELQGDAPLLLVGGRHDPIDLVAHGPAKGLIPRGTGEFEAQSGFIGDQVQVIDA